jgi:RNA polymerase sigma factor for flagellar operon FliA
MLFPHSEPTSEPVSEMFTAASASRAYRASTPSFSEEETLRSHLPLVRSVVDRIKSTLPPHVDVDDLYSVGLGGLIHAARKFDPSLGVSFSSFAATRIRGAVLDELRRMDWMSRSLRGKAKKLTESIGELEQTLGRPATEEEIARELGLSAEEYGALLDEVKPICFLELDEISDREGDEGSLHEVVADASQSTASDQLLDKELRELVLQRLQKLPDMQRKVLAMYYFEDLRLAEIAAVFKVTESRICQIHAQAILSLRAYMKTATNR